MTERGSRAIGMQVRKAYERGLDDYHMTGICPEPAIGRIKDGDSVVFCCRRGEREIELTELFTMPNPPVAVHSLKDLGFVLLTLYHENFSHLPIAFAPIQARNPLAQVLSENHKTQLHIAESEKFAHVTFFFNGGRNEPFEGETDTCVPSPHAAAFETVPRLSLDEVANHLIDSLGCYDFIVANFANGDVIGHTASKPAKLEACEAVSQNLERVAKEALKKGYAVCITADHGNIEKLFTIDGKPDVAHTTNPVAVMILDPSNQEVNLHDGSLCDVGPTILDIMGLIQPADMTGSTLLEPRSWKSGQRVLLLILDGWGLGSGDDNDAIHLASTPYWDYLLKSCPYKRLHASGSYVGLGEGKSGNSEAGHMNLGAGRVVMQDDIRIDEAIRDGSFYSNEAIASCIDKAKEDGKALHLITYLTYKSSHGSMDYALAVCQMAKAKDLEQVYLHIIFDGRSTDPHSAPQLLEELQAKLDKIGIGQIVDGIGRSYALDRDHDYDKVRKAYELMTIGKAD